MGNVPRSMIKPKKSFELKDGPARLLRPDTCSLEEKSEWMQLARTRRQPLRVDNTGTPLSSPTQPQPLKSQTTT